MVGELLLKSGGMRVLPSKENIAIEESFHGSGKIIGIEVTDTRSVIIECLQGEGQGIMMTKDGEMATYARHGVGWPNERGGHTVRAAMLFKTTSQRLERLNKIIVVSELKENEDATRERLWEWK